MTFAGLIVFENPLKPESRETLETLRRCGVRNAIITGDNLLTALSVGISLSLFDYNSRVFVGEVTEGRLTWEEIENEADRIAKGTTLLQPRLPSLRHSLRLSMLSSRHSFIARQPGARHTLEVILHEASADNCVLCLTGEAFELLLG